MDSEQDVGRSETRLEALVLSYRTRILVFEELIRPLGLGIVAAHPAVPPEDGQLAATPVHHGLTLVFGTSRRPAFHT